MVLFKFTCQSDGKVLQLFLTILLWCCNHNILLLELPSTYVNVKSSVTQHCRLVCDGLLQQEQEQPAKNRVTNLTAWHSLILPSDLCHFTKEARHFCGQLLGHRRRKTQNLARTFCLSTSKLVVARKWQDTGGYYQRAWWPNALLDKASRWPTDTNGSLIVQITAVTKATMLKKHTRDIIH